MNELDQRVGDYAAAIVRDVDLLLADVSNLNDEQQNFIKAIKKSIHRFMALCDEYWPGSDDPEITPHTIAFELRSPLSAIAGFNDLLASEVFGTLSELQRQYVQQIKTAHEFILAALNYWINNTPYARS